MRNRFIWVPKRQSRSNTNLQGPKYKWVPKCPSIASCMQDNSRKNGHESTKKKKSPRVSHEPKKGFTSIRRTRGQAIATTSFNQKKQWIQERGVCSTSRTNYHRVPFNYLEENKKRRFSQPSNRKLIKSTSFERALQTPIERHMKSQCDRKRQWVSKVNPPST